MARYLIEPLNATEPQQCYSPVAAGTGKLHHPDFGDICGADAVYKLRRPDTVWYSPLCVEHAQAAVKRGVADGPGD